MDKIRNAVSRRLKEYRKKAGLTQEDFAEENNISVKTIAQWEQCKAEVPLYMILKLKKELGISIDQIYGLETIIDDMNDDELEEYLIKEYVNDTFSDLYNIGDFPMGRDMKEQDIHSFFKEGFNLKFRVNDDGKISISFNKKEKSIIDFLIFKKLITYRIFERLDEEMLLEVVDAEYFINKRLALIMLRNKIEWLEQEQSEFSNSNQYFKEELEESKKVIRLVKKRGI